MFTGLVQSLGILQLIGKEQYKITLSGSHSGLILSDLAIGDSVAVDGVCLTVEEKILDGFVATASPETLARTTLGQRHREASVNLETSMRVGSKLGGHFVTGHVDGVGCLVELLQTAQAWEMTFAAPPSNAQQWQRTIARYLVPKGSIAVNGISLTVAACATDSSWFKAAVIPHTYAETNLYTLKLGDLVNLEGDILGKYVDKLISDRLPDAAQEPQEAINFSFLAENGYL
ncbi:MAG: riboflavin synthase [Cyanophyceae cyanobacterium]